MKKMLDQRLKEIEEIIGWPLALEIDPPHQGDKSRGPLPLYRIMRRIREEVIVGSGIEERKVEKVAMTPSYTGAYLYDWMGAYLQGCKDAMKTRGWNPDAVNYFTK